MTRLFSAKSLIASAIALGALVAGTAAHAGSDVRPYVRPAPAYVQPHTVQFGHDSDRVDRNERFNRNDRFDRNDRLDRNDRFDRRGGPMGDSDRDGIPNRFDRDSRFYDARATYRDVRWGDFDRDGVVNQFDRAPYNPRRP
jgi:hypothetical protein